MNDRTVSRLVTEVFLPCTPVTLRLLVLISWSTVLLCATEATAETYAAHPENYHSLLPKLRPGDILRLEAGHYIRGLRIHDLHGSAAQPIVIEGPAPSSTA